MPTSETLRYSAVLMYEQNLSTMCDGMRNGNTRAVPKSETGPTTWVDCSGRIQSGLVGLVRAAKVCYPLRVRPRSVSVARALVTVATLLLLLPDGSSAGTASVRVEVFEDFTFRVAHYGAAPGEANIVSTVDVAPSGVRIEDAGAPIVAGPGCTAVEGNAVVCRRGRGIDYALVEAGDGDDVVTAAACPAADDYCAWLLADGGDGNDSIRGGDGWDELYGGPGDDRLEGGSGDDYFGGFTGADVFVGGRGYDEVSYETRTNPIRADLDGAADDGEAGEGDTIGADIENITGGSSDDRLTGNSASNELIGGPGTDLLRTGGGDDRVWGDEFACGRPLIIDVVTPRHAYASAGGGVLPSPVIRMESREARAHARVRAGDLSREERLRSVLLASAARSPYRAGGVEDGSDVVDTGAGADHVNGCGGEDKVRLGPGIDRADGGAGADLVAAGSGRDPYLVGGRGDDRILGGSGNDVIEGGRGDDIIRAGPGRDVLHGDERWGRARGDDRMYACDGERDQVLGGRGDDRARVDRFDRAKSAATVRCDAGAALAGRTRRVPR